MSAVQHIQLGTMDLGNRKPYIQLLHGIQIPISPELLVPIAEYQFTERFALRTLPEEEIESDLSTPDGFGGTRVFVLKARYPAEYYILLNRLPDCPETGVEGQWSEEVVTLTGVVEAFFWFEDAVIYDAEFGIALHTYTEVQLDQVRGNLFNYDAGRSAWNAKLQVSADEQGLFARYAGRQCQFDSSEAQPHKLLSMMAESLPNGRLPVPEIIRLIGAKSGRPWEWGRNICSRVNKRLGLIGMPFELACTKSGGPPAIFWRQVAA